VRREKALVDCGWAGRGNRTKSNRTEAAWRKPRQSPPGDYRNCASSRLHSLMTRRGMLSA